MDSASTTTTTTATRIVDPKPNSAVEHNHSRQGNDNPSSSSSVDPITVVFSDVDGTLVHYPTTPLVETTTRAHDNNDWLALPASRTGLRGYLSARTLQLCQTLRNDGKVKLVIVSGMRTSTLMQRLPYLPRAHAYCSESGGRIFYVPNEQGNEENNELRLQPPFVLVEDVEWKRCMQAVVGTTRYHGNQVQDYYYNDHGDSPTADKWSTSTPSDAAAPHETQDNTKDDTGVLWKYAQTLQTTHGLVLDTKGYSTCFRINRKQQPTLQAQQAFDALLGAMTTEKPTTSPSPPQVALPPSPLAYSTNLGCIDVYPNRSGKRNCCHYLMQQFMGRSTTRTIQNNDGNDNDNDSEMFLLNRHAICLCDDDNDLEMALACRCAILPQLTSDRMARVAATQPHHFIVTAPPPNHNDKDNNDTTPTESSLAAHLQATERALECALERVAQSHGAAAPSSSSLHP